MKVTYGPQLVRLLPFIFTLINAQDPATGNIYCTVTSNSNITGPNQGVEYGYYDTNPYQNTAAANTPAAQRYPNYNPTYVNTLAPIYIGRTTIIGFPTNTAPTTPAKIYSDSPTHSLVNVTLVHRGFLYARTSGTYTFTSTSVDDIVLTWVGDNAYSSYTRANANEELAAATTQTPISYNITLTAGQYIAFRVQYSNGQGNAGLTFSITNPAGTVLLSRTASTDVVTQPCDNSARFPAFYGTNPSCQVNTGLTSDGSGNSGLEYGIYNSSTRNSDSTYSNYPLQSFDGTAAVHVGVTNKLNIDVAAGPNDSGRVVAIYSDTTKRFNSAFITIIHRGYVYARVSGNYRFTILAADDIAFVWTGAKAVSGYTRNNADLTFITSSNPAVVTYNQFLNAGQYVPLRIQWGNAQGGAGLQVTVTDPNGLQLLNSTGSTDIYYRTCPDAQSNGAAIPQYVPLFQNSTSYTTITSTATDRTTTGTRTTTLTGPAGTNPGTVQVIIPPSYTTITGPNTFPGGPTGTYTTTIAFPSGTAPGTIQVVTPAVYVTTSALYTGSDIITGPVTTTIAQPSGTAPGTVAVFTPGAYVTTFIAYTGTGGITMTFTSTVAQPSGTNPGTVAIITPASSSTMVSITRPATITTAFASNSCICTPVPF